MSALRWPTEPVLIHDIVLTVSTSVMGASTELFFRHLRCQLSVMLELKLPQTKEWRGRTLVSSYFLKRDLSREVSQLK